MGTIAVGTSGWSYEGWAGHFYPAGLAKARWLSHYVTRFPTVELNATFYRLPSQAAVAAWRRAAPEGFRFAVKGSQGVTHRRQLLGADEMVGLLCDRIGGLGPTLGPVLWQLPPRLELDLARLDGFLAGLRAGAPWAIEFRHPSWLVEETFDLLHRRRVALVAVSSLAMPPVRALTADFAYVRFHGLGGGHGHDYTDEELAPWVSWLLGMAGEGDPGSPTSTTTSSPGPRPTPRAWSNYWETRPSPGSSSAVVTSAQRCDLQGRRRAQSSCRAPLRLTA